MGEKKNPTHGVQTTCLALAYTDLYVLRQMSPEPDLFDSILLFILIKEECSCSSLSLPPLPPPCEGALCKAAINFLCGSRPVEFQGIQLLWRWSRGLSSFLAQLQPCHACSVLSLLGGDALWYGPWRLSRVLKVLIQLYLGCGGRRTATKPTVSSS